MLQACEVCGTRWRRRSGFWTKPMKSTDGAWGISRIGSKQNGASRSSCKPTWRYRRLLAGKAICFLHKWRRCCQECHEKRAKLKSAVSDLTAECDALRRENEHLRYRARDPCGVLLAHALLLSSPSESACAI
jgi:hypothetical protein